MSTGTSQADATIIMIDSDVGDFEVDVSKDGQTREHALLAQTMGVKQMVVCMNKMDDSSVNYAQSRFDEIKNELTIFLKKVGYNPANIPFVPISGWVGDNMVEASDNMPWYSGPTLLACLDNLRPPKRPTDKPLRLPLQYVNKICGFGAVLIGRVENVNIKSSMVVNFVPMNINTDIKSPKMHYE